MRNLYSILLACIVLVIILRYSYGDSSTSSNLNIDLVHSESKVSVMSKKVTIYTTSSCPYCIKAKLLLNKKNIHYEEIDVSNNQALRDSMTQRAGGRKTVPQIFVGELHIGGCDDLYELDRQNALDKLLY